MTISRVPHTVRNVRYIVNRGAGRGQAATARLEGSNDELDGGFSSILEENRDGPRALLQRARASRAWSWKSGSAAMAQWPPAAVDGLGGVATGMVGA
jgi:hypothetical protein